MHRIYALVGLLVLASCSAATPQSEVVEVHVTATDYAFTLDRDQFAVGVPYRFVVTNTSVQPHEFVLTMPEMAGMHHDMDHNDALAQISSADLPAGATSSVEVTFTEPTTAEALEAACHVAGHYELGMHTTITVQ